MSSYKYVHPKANDYFDKHLCFLVFHHISGRLAHRYYDSFRGAVGLAFDVGYVSVDGLLFFTNFVAWLENKWTITNERERRWYEEVYSDYVKIIGSGKFDFD